MVRLMDRLLAGQYLQFMVQTNGLPVAFCIYVTGGHMVQTNCRPVASRSYYWWTNAPDQRSASGISLMLLMTTWTRPMVDQWLTAHVTGGHMLHTYGRQVVSFSCYRWPHGADQWLASGISLILLVATWSRLMVCQWLSANVIDGL